MNIIKNFARVVSRRPMALVLLAVSMLALTVADYFNPLFTLLVGLGTVAGGSMFEGIVYLLQLALKPVVLVKIFGVLLLVSLVMSLISALILSGYLNVVNNTLNEREKMKKEMIKGIKNCFRRIFLISLVSFLLLIVGVLFIFIAAIPALVVTRTWMGGKPNYLPPMIFVDMLTVISLFFIFMFLRVYLSYWFPAALNYQNRPFAVGKRTADRFFWRITGQFVIFDLVLIAVEVLFIYLRIYIQWTGTTPADIFFLAANWIFNTLFAALFISYIFSSFKRFKQIESTQ